jgi:pimeloyl-ACP methyl ester carboxylesterase
MGPEISSVAAVRAASALPAPAGGGPRQAASPAWPVLSWRTLRRDSYRDALRAGALQCGIYFEEPPYRGRPTVVFIHGAAGAPGQFTALAAALHARVNRAAFLWDYTARLAPTAERWRAALLRLPAGVTIVAHSIGTLLPAYAGATDPDGLLQSLAAVYLNPLIGGSRYAGDFRALRWLRLGAVLQRAFCRPNVLDLAPESDFQCTICGPESAASSFARHTVLLFTERRGEEPDIRPSRVPHYFGRTREALLERLGTVRRMPPPHASGHNAPLLEPNLVLPILEELLDRRVGGHPPHVAP